MDEILGTIKRFAGGYAPQGFLDCDGRIMSIMSNQALFSILGFNYGGDGHLSFALPDLRPLDDQGQRRAWEPGEPREIICVEGIYPMRPN